MESFSNLTNNNKKRQSQAFDRQIQKITVKMDLLETPTKFNRIENFLDEQLEYGLLLKKFKKAA